MQSQNFTTTLLADQSPAEVFETLKDVRRWWTGLYNEHIEGSTDKLGDEFTFAAGDGAHFTKQKLVELVPDKKIVWLVTDSRLTFISDPAEWTGSKIGFDISKKGDKTEVRFTHEGLRPENECYDSCSSAWGQYMKQSLQPLLSKTKTQKQ